MQRTIYGADDRKAGSESIKMITKDGKGITWVTIHGVTLYDEKHKEVGDVRFKRPVTLRGEDTLHLTLNLVFIFDKGKISEIAPDGRQIIPDENL